MGRGENDIAVTRPQKEFPCWSKGRNIMTMTHKSKEKEESISEAKILGFLVILGRGMFIVSQRGLAAPL